MNDSNTAGLIAVADLMKELGIKKDAQIDVCRRYKVLVSVAVPKGKGYSHYVTPAYAQKLRDSVAKSREKKVPVFSKQCDELGRTTLAQDVKWIRENLDRLISALGGVA